MTEDVCIHEMLILDGILTCSWCKGVELDFPLDGADE